MKVPLRNEVVLGIVIATTDKPDFSTKEILGTFRLPAIPEPTLKLATWLQEFYPAPLGVITQQFLPARLDQKTRQEQPPVEKTQDQLPTQPTLTTEQQSALNEIREPNTYLLHGRTGSGKTRIYTELTKRVITVGKSALILSPEIGLTSQLAANFESQFGSSVVVIHSQLSPTQRRSAWIKILTATQPIIVVGPRSALFTPLGNIGLIVIDESHEQAYKQEQAPYYHATRVASQLSHIHKSILVLGSATPSVVDYYLAEQKHRKIIHLNKLAIERQLNSKLDIVDIKDRDQFQRAPHLSIALIEAITHSLNKGEQALLYLNRRGTARITLCEKCGWQALCPHCDLPLTYHGDKHNLRCHVCTYTTKPIITCPSCNNASISLRGFGTKAIVEETQQLFPDARIIRFDSDNTKSERLESKYEHVIKGKVDILIGTQTVGKGLDLPRLSTLGVIAADTSLYIPDFTAQEKTYQLLNQVIGRVGRGHAESHIVIQTYYPDSQLLHDALQQNWKNFYNAELQERKKYFFPPFCYMLKLTCRRAQESSAQRKAESLKKVIESLSNNVKVEGPSPCFHEKISGKYQWQLVVKSRNRSDLSRLISEASLTSDWSYDLDPVDLL